MAEAITINDQELAIICDLMALAVRPSEEGSLTRYATWRRYFSRSPKNRGRLYR
jgi:hypothetical protein